MPCFKLDIPVNEKEYTKAKFYDFMNSKEYSHIIGSIFSKEEICIAYVDKDFVNKKLIRKEIPTIFISGNNLESPVLQEILNEILQI